MDSPTYLDVLLLPAGLLLFGALAYGLSFGVWRRTGTFPAIRWLGVVLGLVALFVGVQTVGRLIDPETGPFYQATLVGRKVVAAHYAALLAPILGLIAVAGVEFYVRSRTAPPRGR